MAEKHDKADMAEDKKLIKKAKKQAYLNPLSIKQDLEKKAKKMSKKII